MEELFNNNPDKVCFRTGLQGVSGEFWYYECHFKGNTYKFLVPEEIAKEKNLAKKVKLTEIKDFFLVKGIDHR